MKTSYFSNPNILKTNMILVSISKKTPDWFPNDILIYRPLCPSWHLIMAYKNNSISVEEYTKRYYDEVLNKLNPEKVYSDLSENALLLCYEKSGEFCHRHIVSKWLMDALDIIIMEL